MWKKQKILDKDLLKHLSLLGQLGLAVITSILIFFFVFLYLDRKLQTGGVLVGVGYIYTIVIIPPLRETPQITIFTG